MGNNANHIILICSYYIVHNINKLRFLKMKKTEKQKNISTKLAYGLFAGTIAVCNVDALAAGGDEKKKNPVVSNNSQNPNNDSTFVQSNNSISSNTEEDYEIYDSSNTLINIPPLKDIKPHKQKATADLQLGLVKIMAEYIKNNSSTSKEYAELIKYWVAPKGKTDKAKEVLSSLFSFSSKEKSTQTQASDMAKEEIEAKIPALKELVLLRNKIQEKDTAKNLAEKTKSTSFFSNFVNIGSIGVHTNTNTANQLAAWVESDLYPLAYKYANELKLIESKKSNILSDNIKIDESIYLINDADSSNEKEYSKYELLSFFNTSASIRDSMMGSIRESMKPSIQDNLNMNSSKIYQSIKLQEISTNMEIGESEKKYFTDVMNENRDNKNRVLKQATVQIQFLANILYKKDQMALGYFEKLFTIPKIDFMKNIQNPSIVVGDIDGSDARMYVAAIQAGTVTLNYSELELLADVLVEEFRASGLQRTMLTSFQSNQNVAANIAQINNKAIFHSDGIQTVFIGDIIYDRFTNNFKNKADIITKLFATNKVVFIKGNHDSFTEASCIHSLQAGGNATDIENVNFINDTELTTRLKEIENKYFVNSYYDLVNKIFYIHNGLEYNDSNNTIMTAFGEFDLNKIDSLEALSANINKQDLKNVDAGHFTNFRPKNSKMVNIPLFKDNVIVHGHDDFIDLENLQVINVNARNKSGVAPIAIRLGN